MKPVSLYAVNGHGKGDPAGPVAKYQFKIIRILPYNSVNQIDFPVPQEQSKNITEIGFMLRVKPQVKLEVQVSLYMDGSPCCKIKAGSLVEREFVSFELHSVILPGSNH